MVKIICGLGNPGLHYEHTRHNLGFRVVDRLAERLDVCHEGPASRFNYRTVRLAGRDVQLIKPVTFLNRSGLAITEALARFNADPIELFVISDDFNLPLGALRIRKSGSSGGHNGLESIIDELGRDDFARMRLGIGLLPDHVARDRKTIPGFLLSRFEESEEEIVAKMISQAVKAIEVALNESLDLAISRYNTANPTPGP